MTDADSEALRRDFYEAWSTRASDRGPIGRQIRQHRGHGEDPRAAPRSGAAARFPQLRRLRAGDAHGAVQPGGVRFPAPAGARRAPGRASANSPSSKQFAGRKLNAWDVGYYAEKLQAQAVLHLAGRAAPVLPAAARARRPVRGRRAAVRREDRRAHRACRCSTPTRASSRSSTRSGKVRAGFYLDACARAEEARRRVDGRLRRPQGLRRRAHRAGGLPGVQFPAGRRRASRRCSRTTTS